MSIIKCKECKNEISSKAKTCPRCGAEQNRTSIFTWIILIVILFGFINAIFFKKSDEPQKQQISQKKPIKTPEQTKKDDDEFNSVLTGAIIIKKSMKDSSSFELISAGLMKDGTKCYIYSAKNSFNAKIQERFVISKNESGSSDAIWNRHCAGKTGDDYTKIKYAM